MAMNSQPANNDRDKGLLACGRSFEDVWEHAARPADEHESGCPHCQDARARFTQLQQATRDLTEHDAVDPDFQVSPTLKSSIMEIARTEVRRSRMLPLVQPRPEQLESSLTISEHAISEQIRAAADAMPGVHARRCTVDIDKTEHGEPNEPDTGAEGPARLTINLRVAVAARTTIPDTMGELRARIADRLSDRTGLHVTTINITVEDVYDA